MLRNINGRNNSNNNNNNNNNNNDNNNNNNINKAACFVLAGEEEHPGDRHSEGGWGEVICRLEPLKRMPSAGVEGKSGKGKR